MSELLRMLSEDTGLSEIDLRTIIATAPNRYKTYEIDKRRGGKREISQPARELKVLQRAMVQRILSGLAIHSAAMAYRPGISIRNNAAYHAGDGPILKFDFKDFFPNIQAVDWEKYCEKHSIFDHQEDVKLSSRILFRKSSRYSPVLRLAIGAPSSPMLSNILMFEFDEYMQSYAESQKAKYTRYADDLTFSAPRTGYLNGVEKVLRQAIHKIKNPKLQLNEDKTVLATRKYKRMVTGLILANDGSVSLGHQRKRNMRSAVHHWLLGKLSSAEQANLAGLLAFAEDVEPSFVFALARKYGTSTLKDIKKLADIES
ncbi:hypothetical protein CO666_01795 [Rhizobium chutanense]|uniref:RNA-directed DNA polymerase n=1 Tax=Rhizobium chutanense TaxID=2035448 RepID=A0A2A6JIX6_9HYPH|nr:retron St85 family RNA-directed DNA polymerase [Rhizobium chutanense]PDT06370.1 hypothetical protein CO666_01795 [Rhizobium chutanense]